MKNNLKNKLTAFILLLTIGPTTAQVAKDLVVIEKFSGVNCNACPRAVHHIHDLIDNENAKVAVISYQTGGYSIPKYNNTDSQGRHSYYSSEIIGYPTTIIGGQHVPSLNTYLDYKSHYDSEYAELSPVSLMLTHTDNGNGNLTVNATVTEVIPAGSNLVLMITITETNIDQDWKGETFLYDVNRKMLPNNNGTILNFSSSNPSIISESFTLDSSWDRDYLSAIAFVQNTTTKEIIQATKISLADISKINDAMVDRIYYDTEKYCGGTMDPIIRIRNSGSTPLQNATINYSIGGASNSINWSGNLTPFEREDVQLPQITFTPSTNVTFEANTSNPNGTADEDQSNDMISQVFIQTNLIGNTPSLEIKTDYFAQFLTEWKIFDDQGNAIDSAGKSDWQEYSTYNYNFNLTDGCYEFVITDVTGNGFTDYTTEPGQSHANEENGYFIFYDHNGNILEQEENFGYEFILPFEVSSTTEIKNTTSAEQKLKIYPNPTSGVINIEHFNNLPFKIEISDVRGSVVFSSQKSFTKTTQLNLDNLKSGYYFIKILDSSSNKVSSLFIK